ncbi:hypothetical protein ACFBBL_004501 [Escherichia coli]
MTEWLNAHFGADAATYLSLLVGVLALFGIGAVLHIESDSKTT